MEILNVADISNVLLNRVAIEWNGMEWIEKETLAKKAHHEFYLWFTTTFRIQYALRVCTSLDDANVSVCILYQESSMHVQKHITTTNNIHSRHFHLSLSFSVPHSINLSFSLYACLCVCVCLSPVNCNSGWNGRLKSHLSFSLSLVQ